MVSYSGQETKECGAEAAQDFDEHKENVAYWFKVIVYFTMWIPPLSIEGPDL
jgi:hypothetical protein